VKVDVVGLPVLLLLLPVGLLSPQATNKTAEIAAVNIAVLKNLFITPRYQ
jgi:hypothetical protein